MTVTLCDDQADLGRRVAAEFAGAVHQALTEHDETAVILATGNSQLPFVLALAGREDIPWGRIQVFHMDEYLGMDADHRPASAAGSARKSCKGRGTSPRWTTPRPGS